MMMYPGYGMAGTELLLLGLGGLLVLAGIAALVVWAIRGGQGGVASGGGPAPQQRDEAYETARARFARGEITQQEFEEIKRALGY